MFKLFKNSFKTTNDCIILATPLIIFLSILGWYIHYAYSSVDTILKGLLAIVTILVMLSGFAAAWLYMTKKTLALSKKIVVFDKDRAKDLLGLLISLPKGIGRLFLPLIGVVSSYILIYGAIILIVSFLVSKFVGTIDLSTFDINSLQLSSKELFDEFINELTEKELAIINIWYLLITICSTLVSFLTLLWIPEIVYGEKNPYKALWYSTIKILKNFKSGIVIYIYISTLIISINILNTLLMVYPLLYFFVLILYYYFIVYIVVLIFTYYEQNYT